MEQVEPQTQGKPSFTLTFHGSGNTPTIRPGQGGGLNLTGKRKCQSQPEHPVHYRGHNRSRSTNDIQDNPLDHEIPADITFVEERSPVQRSRVQAGQGRSSNETTGGGGQISHELHSLLDFARRIPEPENWPFSCGWILLCIFLAAVPGTYFLGVTHSGASGLFEDKAGSGKAPFEPGFGVGVKSCFSCMACPKPHKAENCPDDGNRYACVTYEIQQEDGRAFVNRGCVEVKAKGQGQSRSSGCTLEANNVNACYCDQDNCNWKIYSDNDNEVKASTEKNGRSRFLEKVCITVLLVIFIILFFVNF